MSRFAAIWGLLVFGCARSEANKAAPSQASARVTMAAAQPSSPPAHQQPSIAVFDENDTLLICMDPLPDVPPEHVKRMAKESKSTLLKQSCESLGRVALTTCTTKFFVERFYLATHSDKYMPSCVKKGGQWETNRTGEAELERSQQRLKKMREQHP